MNTTLKRLALCWLSLTVVLVSLSSTPVLHAQVTVEQEALIRIEIERQVTAGELILPEGMSLTAAQETTVGVVRLLLQIGNQPTLGERILAGTLFWTSLALAMEAAGVDLNAPPPTEPPPPEPEPEPEPPPPSTTVTNLVVSTSSDRISPFVMNGATVSGAIYAFVLPEAGVQQVEFFLDGSATFSQRERRSPFDLAGTASNGLARPFDTTLLVNGPHEVRVVVQLSDGTTEEYVVTYTVAN